VAVERLSGGEEVLLGVDDGEHVCCCEGGGMVGLEGGRVAGEGALTEGLGQGEVGCFAVEDREGEEGSEGEGMGGA